MRLLRLQHNTSTMRTTVLAVLLHVRESTLAAVFRFVDAFVALYFIL